MNQKMSRWLHQRLILGLPRSLANDAESSAVLGDYVSEGVECAISNISKNETYKVQREHHVDGTHHLVAHKAFVNLFVITKVTN